MNGANRSIPTRLSTQSFGGRVVANGTLYLIDAGLGREGPASRAAHAFTVH
jgi:hypothetical protein